MIAVFVDTLFLVRGCGSDTENILNPFAAFKTSFDVLDKVLCSVVQCF